MKDPFFIPPIPWLSQAVQPWAERLSLQSLSLHIHEVFAAALLYTIIYYPLSPLLSTYFFPNHYPQLPRRRRINWDSHVVSFVQSTLINALACWVMINDDERAAMDAEERVWGYTGACGMVQALAAGYFLWDLIVTSRNIDVFGFGTLAHAISALAVYSLGFRPFVNYYACNFILWELSTPFLNIHWFLDKLNMTGTRIQLYNGLALLGTFFTCRLVFGTYQSYLVFSDIWAATQGNVSAAAIERASAPGSPLRFVTETSSIPLWLAYSYLASNMVLNSLNMYWFTKMIQAVSKRFPAASSKEASAADQKSLPEKAETTGLQTTDAKAYIRGVASLQVEDIGADL